MTDNDEVTPGCGTNLTETHKTNKTNEQKRTNANLTTDGFIFSCTGTDWSGFWSGFWLLKKQNVACWRRKSRMKRRRRRGTKHRS